jgi:hypothetical protein
VQGKAERVDCLSDTLILHARIQEEIFYPVVRPAPAGRGLCGPAPTQGVFGRIMGP